MFVEKFAYMVNSEEFPALNDSSAVAPPEKTTSNALLDSPATLEDYEPYPHDSFYQNRGINASTNGNLVNGISNQTTIDLSRYYTLPNSELPNANTAALEDTITTLTSNRSNDSVAATKDKDPGNFIRSLKKYYCCIFSRRPP